MSSSLSLDDFSESDISEEELMKQRKVAKQAQKSPSEKPKVQADPSKPAIGRHIFTAGGLIIVPPANAPSKAFERKKEEPLPMAPPETDLEYVIIRKLCGTKFARQQQLIRQGKMRIERRTREPIWLSVGYTPTLYDQLKYGTALDPKKLRIEEQRLKAVGRMALSDVLVQVKIFMGEKLPCYPPFFDGKEGAWNPLRIGRVDWCGLKHLEDNWEFYKTPEIAMNTIDELTGKYRSYYEVVTVSKYVLEHPHFWYYNKWEHQESYLEHVQTKR